MPTESIPFHRLMPVYHPRLHTLYSHFLFDSFAHGSLLCTHECLTSAQTSSTLSTQSKNIMAWPVPSSSRSSQLKRRLHKWPPMHTTNLKMYKWKMNGAKKNEFSMKTSTVVTKFHFQAIKIYRLLEWNRKWIERGTRRREKGREIWRRKEWEESFYYQNDKNKLFELKCRDEVVRRGWNEIRRSGK